MEDGCNHGSSNPIPTLYQGASQGCPLSACCCIVCLLLLTHSGSTVRPKHQIWFIKQLLETQNVLLSLFYSWSKVNSCSFKKPQKSNQASLFWLKSNLTPLNILFLLTSGGFKFPWSWMQSVVRFFIFMLPVKTRGKGGTCCRCELVLPCRSIAVLGIIFCS